MAELGGGSTRATVQLKGQRRGCGRTYSIVCQARNLELRGPNPSPQPVFISALRARDPLLEPERGYSYEPVAARLFALRRSSVSLALRRIVVQSHFGGLEGKLR